MTATQYKMKAMSEITSGVIELMAQEYADSFSEESKLYLKDHLELMKQSFATGMIRALNILPETDLKEMEG